MRDSTDPIYILGHKHPDADAICSAIGYAAYKRAHGWDEYVPARCGNSNARIDAILERFRTPLPTFIGDVTPRLDQAMRQDFLHVAPETTCAEALRILDEYDIRSLPVVDAEGKALGLVTIFDLGQYFTPRVSDPLRMREVRSTITAITRSLEAEPLHLHEPDRMEKLFVRVGAMDSSSFGDFAAREVSAEESVIVVGDRRVIQEKCLQLGVRLLVITGNLPVDEDIVEGARERGVSLIRSPYDSATTSWIIRSASFLDHLYEREYLTFHREETVRDALRKVNRKYAPLYFVVGAGGVLEGVFSKADIYNPPRARICLVDHNELSQAVDGAAQVEILEVVDHHRLGNAPTDQPILFINRPLGSTSTIVADLFFQDGLEPDPATAGILMAGIISDTLHLTGPTTTETDRAILARLAGIAGEDPQELADSIFSSGSVLVSSPPEEVVELDCKIYQTEETSYSVSQIEELGFANFWAHKENVCEALEAYREENQLGFSALLVTDINKQDSLLVVEGEERFREAVSYPAVEGRRIFDLKGIVSRKKQLIPYLSKILAD